MSRSPDDEGRLQPRGSSAETASDPITLLERRFEQSGELGRFLEQCSALRRSKELIEASDGAARAALDATRRTMDAIDAALAPVRNALAGTAAAVDRFLERLRTHPNHVIFAAHPAACSPSAPMSDQARIPAVFAAFQRCKPVRRRWSFRGEMTEDEAVSATAEALRAISDTWIWHPRLRRRLASAIALVLRRERPHPTTRLDDRLDVDACAVASRRGIPARVASMQVGPLAIHSTEKDPIIKGVIAAEIAQQVQELAARMRETDRGSAAAFDYFAGEDDRATVAKRHGVTPRQVGCAEDRVRRRFESLRRHAQ